jgi:hypothetical protein
MQSCRRQRKSAGKIVEIDGHNDDWGGGHIAGVMSRTGACPEAPWNTREAAEGLTSARRQFCAADEGCVCSIATVNRGPGRDFTAAGFASARGLLIVDMSTTHPHARDPRPIVSRGVRERLCDVPSIVTALYPAMRRDRRACPSFKARIPYRCPVRARSPFRPARRSAKGRSSGNGPLYVGSSTTIRPT